MAVSGFQDRPVQPLRHPSERESRAKMALAGQPGNGRGTVLGRPGREGRSTSGGPAGLFSPYGRKSIPSSDMLEGTAWGLLSLTWPFDAIVSQSKWLELASLLTTKERVALGR